MSGFRNPQELAQDMVQLGIKKTSNPLKKEILLSILAGAYIGLAAHFATLAGTGDVPWFGMKKIVMGVVFSQGLMMVMIPGAELFTGNCLISAAVLDKKVSFGAMLKNWLIVWLGNFAGALALAAMMAYGTGLVSGAVGATALDIAAGKCALSVPELFFRGIGANWMVCIGVLMAMAATDIAGKILGIIFPVMAFVAIGFEHAIANMYFLPVALMVKGAAAGSFPALTWGLAMKNILVSTLGNIAGGALVVGALYWLIYVKKDKE